MKIICDNKEQKEKIMQLLSDEVCPHDIGLSDCDCMKVMCKDCWKAAMEVEVKNESKSD